MICVECLCDEVRSKPGSVRASLFAGGWKGGLDYARLSAGIFCSLLFICGGNLYAKVCIFTVVVSVIVLSVNSWQSLGYEDFTNNSTILYPAYLTGRSFGLILAASGVTSNNFKGKLFLIM